MRLPFSALCFVLLLGSTVFLHADPVAARPSLRDLKEEAENNKQDGIDARRKGPDFATKWKRYQSDVFGIAFEYPERWTLRYQNDRQSGASQYYKASVGEYLALYASDYKDNVIFIAQKPFDHTLDAADLEADFLESTRQPESPDVSLSLPHYREFALREAQTKERGGYRVHEAEFTFLQSSSTYHVREMRWSVGNTMYVVQYRAIDDRYDRDLFIYEHLIDTIRFMAKSDIGMPQQTDEDDAEREDDATEREHEEETESDSRNDDASDRRERARERFADTPRSHRYFQQVQDLADAGIVTGNPDGTYRPDATINRAEFMKIIIEAAFKNRTDTDDNCFPDVRSEWFAASVCFAKKNGMIGGYPDGTFRPGNSISFAEAAKIVVNAFGDDTTTTVSGAPWYQTFLDAVARRRATPPTANRPDHPLTRGEMAWLIRMYMQPHAE